MFLAVIHTNLGRGWDGDLCRAVVEGDESFNAVSRGEAHTPECHIKPFRATGGEGNSGEAMVNTVYMV